MYYLGIGGTNKIQIQKIQLSLISRLISEPDKMMWMWSHSLNLLEYMYAILEDVFLKFVSDPI